TRRTTSASKPTPQLNPNRRPFARPTEMRRVLPAASASPSRRAAATGSRGNPSSLGITLVPPPGTNPSGTRPSAPFSASLKPPSPRHPTRTRPRRSTSASSAPGHHKRCLLANRDAAGQEPPAAPVATDRDREGVAPAALAAV